MAASSDLEKEPNVSETNNMFKAKLAFLFGVTFASVVGGFGVAIGSVRKRSPSTFSGNVQEEGAKLALRALGWGTVISVGGVATLSVLVKSVYELRKVDILLCSGP